MFEVNSIQVALAQPSCSMASIRIQMQRKFREERRICAAQGAERLIGVRPWKGRIFTIEMGSPSTFRGCLNPP